MNLENEKPSADNGEEGYPIRAVAQLTGLSIDTLRAWERRYEAVRPQRIGKGRLYSETDIKRLTLLKQVVERGHSIGRSASLTDEQLLGMLDRSNQLTARVKKTAFDTSLNVEWHAVMASIKRFDYMETDREINRLAALLPPHALIHQVVVPLLEAVGNEWHAGRLSVAHEHMISSILHNLLGSLIRLYSRGHPTCHLLFAAPSGEQHEFGIMTSAMLAARGGLGIIYLGKNLPASDLLEAANQTNVNAVVIGVKGANGRELIHTNLSILANNLSSKIELWIGGNVDEAFQKVTTRPAGRTVVLTSLEELSTNLIRMGAQF